ncbi:MAG: hypothetical protein KJO24_04120, partial [Gammaproteobacteria bacterium]|nr:hypothetical protein [Gammaproteobacteria bacterium]
MDEKLYSWDAHSDQPHVIRNKAAKRKLYLRGAIGSLKTLLTGLALPLVAVPLAWPLAWTRRKPGPHTINGLGLCVNPDNPLPEKRPVSDSELQELVQDLAVNHLLIRLPLAEIENLDRYIDFIHQFSNKEIVVNILQDRRHIDSPAMLRDSLEKIFAGLQQRVKYFQIGNAVNRRKWAFVSLDEYLDFFATAQQLRDAHYPQLKLAGGCIIDFELPNFARSVLHGKAIR